MSKNIPILIIGFGSIGQRHWRNLQTLGYKNIAVYDIDAKKVTESGAKTVSDLKPQTLEKFQIVFVCNPNSEHIKTALAAARAGCHLFIEKPLAHSLTGITELTNICGKKKLTVMVACNMRFHPALVYIKKYLTGQKLGQVYNIDHRFGYYLPSWRPGQDYRLNYAAKKSTGGGIVLDDIHEYDLLFWLNDFASVKQGKIITNHSGALDIETEDEAVGTFLFANGVLGTVRSDYLSRNYVCTCQVTGEKGNLKWDFKENIIWLENAKEKKALLQIRDYDLNQMYLDELKYFLSCAARSEKTFNDIDRAGLVTKYCILKK